MMRDNEGDGGVFEVPSPSSKNMLSPGRNAYPRLIRTVHANFQLCTQSLSADHRNLILSSFLFRMIGTSSLQQECINGKYNRLS